MVMTRQFGRLRRGLVWEWLSQPVLCATSVKRSNLDFIWYSNENKLKSVCVDWAVYKGCYCLQFLITIFTCTSVHGTYHQKPAEKETGTRLGDYASERKAKAGPCAMATRLNIRG